MTNKSFALAVIPFCLLACSKVKKLDDNLTEMHDSTAKMQSTTDQMARNTNNTDTMYKQLRAKEARSTRIQEIENVMKEETLIETKITSAGVYFKAMEYQLATEYEVFSDPDSMRSMKEDAANDFIRVAGDLYDKIKLKNVDPTKDLEKNNTEAAFIAFATAMHLNHHYQEELAERHHVATVSMYDLIKNALRKDKLEMDARANGSRQEVKYTSWEQILVSGVRKEICIELIKARVDMLSAIALKFMTDQREMELSQFLKALTFKASFGHYGAIDLPLTINDANDATKQTAIDALEGALKAKRFLNNEIKVEKKLNKTLRSAYKSMKVQAESDRKLENIAKQIEELLN